jgi:predicted metal-dependent enzyme (double-stranded beta helix superfamily)
MSAELDRFCAECRDILRAAPGASGTAKIKSALEAVLSDPKFVAEYCGPQVKSGLYTLYEDPDLGFQVLAHINERARLSPPHDHGASWAVYGQAVGHTDMVEYRRTDDRSKPEQAQLEVVRKYRLEPGNAGIYADGAIHSIDYPDGSKFVRVTGTNLDRIVRDAFDLKTGNVRQMLPQQST